MYPRLPRKAKKFYKRIQERDRFEKTCALMVIEASHRVNVANIIADPTLVPAVKIVRLLSANFKYINARMSLPPVKTWRARAFDKGGIRIPLDLDRLEKLAAGPPVLTHSQTRNAFRNLWTR